MKPARLIVLIIAVCAAGFAAMIIMNSGGTTPVIVEKKTPSASIEVLVASNELPVGQTLKPNDIRWQAWPADLAPSGALVRSSVPNAAEETAGTLVRQSFLAGEPIRREKLVKGDGSGFLSAVLPSGMRAFAISIDTRGATSAGGFILPNDRVDVIRTFREDEGTKGNDGQASETVLPNVRVLAIGQAIQERNGEKVMSGETATLEVTPSQAETLALAQRTGQLSLVLRSFADANKTEAPRESRADNAVTVVRYGVARNAPKR